MVVEVCMWEEAHASCACPPMSLPIIEVPNWLEFSVLRYVTEYCRASIAFETFHLQQPFRKFLPLRVDKATEVSTALAKRHESNRVEVRDDLVLKFDGQ